MNRSLLTLAVTLALIFCLASPAYAADFRIGWDSICDHTKFQKLDPIGGATHLHEFFGTSPTADMSLENMRSQSSNCLYRPQDTAGYWTPALFLPNKVVTALMGNAYYRTQVEPENVTPMPDGLKLVAGDAHATSEQPLTQSFWTCYNVPLRLVYGGKSYPFACNTPNDHLRGQVRFPQCWNGTDLDSPDHKSHMAYPDYDPATGLYNCPSTHPWAVPQLVLHIEFPGSGEIGGGDYNQAVLSCGNKYCWHGDFFQSWKPTFGGMAWQTVYCLRAQKICGANGTGA